MGLSIIKAETVGKNVKSVADCQFRRQGKHVFFKGSSMSYISQALNKCVMALTDGLIRYLPL